MKLIELHNVYKTYQLGEIEVPVLKGVSLTISQGEFVALMGTSGSGKTTLMNILGCLDRPTSGQYWLDGLDVTALTPDERAYLRNRKLGFVFQIFNLLPRTSALENVIVPLSYNGFDISDRQAHQRAQDLLERMGLSTRVDYEPSQLSGGQQQRVAIARALVNSPPVLLADEPTGNLDSQTSEEVLVLFQRLNAEGVTIILVTHDENVARHAGRIIRINDGVAETVELAAEPDAKDSYGPRAEKSQPHSHTSLPRLRWMLRTALNGLRRNILRAALTALGIIIGVAAVIAMMEIGRGSADAIQRTIASMGANNLIIFPGTASSGGVTFGMGAAMTLTPQDVEAILRECPAVKAAAPIVRARIQIVYGNRNWVPIYIFGTTPAFLDVREWPLEAGEPLTEQDVRNVSKVCLLGKRLVRELFGGEDPLNKEIRVNNIIFKVVGVLSSKGANMIGMDQDDILVAPWTTIRYRVTRSSLTNVNQSAKQTTSTSSTSEKVNTLNELYPSTQLSLYPARSTSQEANNPMPVRFANVDQIMVAAHSTQDIPRAIQQITQLLRERHRIRPGEPEDFNIRDMTEPSRALSSTATLMTKLLLAVALISLVVGGVGIMNIMLVSVTERTREIGLRLAVGARSRDILKQFLTEAVLLCFCGGIVGILFGRGASMVITTVFGWPTGISPLAILAAFAVSVTVGVTFGYYPAWKASRLDPINALRYE
ncbi:ABC transporter permease [Desulfobacca acetoxidans]|uniref:Phosphonate-transporting ATPase n=1 Tax=Desulfobacca acetoxidans (strain ATCC 700848 / DSM 11109 / ASRB2) TaxID=880072 RepID=F2NC60_DESAR|nr:ABC transporter permease [Desulfobacca acetoxidans]AEB08855.1 Phosphonate-transporting ATPase [Desulfobacca acetoxidans DSM 11109]